MTSENSPEAEDYDQDAEPSTMAPPGESPTDPETIAEAREAERSESSESQ